MGMLEFANKLEKINGRRVRINTTHLLYGNQKIKCELDLINDDERLGFKVNGQDIYMNKHEITYTELNSTGDEFYFGNNLRTIKMKTY